MEEKKVLTIDTMICDLRTVSEETLQSYEKIYISAMTVFITERTQELFHRYPVDLDAMAVEKLDENVRLVEQNGVYKITDQEPAGAPTYLTVSGQLQIAKGAEKALESYVKIVVNGKAVYPKSIEKALVGKLTCNGAMTVYPDDAIFVEKELIADKVFAARAQENTAYYTDRKAYLLDADAVEKLAEKHIRILTGKAIVAESLLDTAALLLDEDAEIILVPEGCCCVKGDVCLDQKLVLRYGKKLLITGNVTDAQTGVAAALEYLQVIGQAMIPESGLEAFESVCESCSEVTTYKGKLLRDIGELAVDQKLLEAAKELTVVDCGCVRVVEGVTAEQIKDRLFLKDCGAVECAEELQGILRLQSDGVGAFSGKETAQGAENSTGEADGKVTKISAMKYVM